MRSASGGTWRMQGGNGGGPALRPGLLAMLLAVGVAACAGSSPDAPSAAADASAPATAPGDPAGASADRSAVATAEAPAASETNPDSRAPLAESSADQDAAPRNGTRDIALDPVADSAPNGRTAETDAPPPAGPAAAPSDEAGEPTPDALAAGGEAEVEPPIAAPEAAPPQSAAAATAPGDRLPALPPGSGLASGRPYVTIRFNRSNVGYEPALAAAVRRAVARRPNVAFDLVAVTPQAGTAEEAESRTALAQSQAAAVMRSLAALGIGPERVSLQPWDGPPSDIHEIRLYIR